MKTVTDELRGEVFYFPANEEEEWALDEEFGPTLEDKILDKLAVDFIDEPFDGRCPACEEPMVRTDEVTRTWQGFKARLYRCPDGDDPVWVYESGPLKGFMVPDGGDSDENIDPSY